MTGQNTKARNLHRSAWLLWVLVLFVVLGAPAAEQEFSYFRSDEGLQTSSGPLTDTLEASGALRWRVALDSGHSTPIIRSEKIFLTTYRPEAGELALEAREESSGKMLWRTALKPAALEQTHALGNPATATPACDGQRLFVFFGSSGLFCYDLEGRKLWEQRLGPFRDEYGAGSSPILFDDKVLINQDHDIDSFLTAFDRASGRLLWKTSRPDAVRSYSTPVVWMQDSQPRILVAGALELTAYNPADGRRVWWAEGLARIVIPMPVISGPVIYMASWAPGGDSGKRLELDPWSKALEKWDADHDGKLARNEIDDREVLDRFNRMDLDQDGALDQKEWERHAAVFRRAHNAVLALKPSGTGELRASDVLWKHARGVPYVSTPVLYRGSLWMAKEGGIVTKLEAATGRLLAEERVPGFGNYFASPVAGDGKVYFCSEPGTVSIVAAEGEWRVISSRDFHEKIYATPVLRGSRLYLRTERGLYCYEGKQGAFNAETQ
jgi:outer membrane protein assembly factor BamB